MSAWPCENVATRLVATGLSSFSNSARMRSSISSTEPIWVKVPRPISAARVIRKVLGAEPMPTMNTRERPLVADGAVGEEHELTQVVDIAIAPVGQRRPHGQQHFGAALRLQRRDEA